MSQNFQILFIFDFICFHFISVEYELMNVRMLIRDPFLRFQSQLFSQLLWIHNRIGAMNLKRLCASQTQSCVILLWCQIMQLGLVNTFSKFLHLKYSSVLIKIQIIFHSVRYLQWYDYVQMTQ